MPLICANCGLNESHETKLQTCSMCKSIHYCSKTCQRSHWEADHRKECKELCTQKEAASQRFGATAMRDIQKWVNSNGTGFYDVVFRALSCHDAKRSKHKTHVVSLLGDYNPACKAVELLYHKVYRMEVAQAQINAFHQRRQARDPNVRGQTPMNLHEQLHSDIQLPQGKKMFTVVLIFVRTSEDTMLRTLPLRLASDFLPWLQEERSARVRSKSVEELLQLINLGYYDSRIFPLPSETNPQNN